MEPLRQDKKSGILYRKWSALDIKANMILVHGLGAHSGRWDFLPDFFLPYQIGAYAIELPGFGETTTPRGHIHSFQNYYDDILRLLDIVQHDFPEKPVFIVGESMGALIAFNMILRYPSLLTGLVCLSPAFKSKMKMSILTYLRIFSALFYNPKKLFRMPFNGDMCTRDEERRQTIKDDASEHRLASAKLLWNIAESQWLSVHFRARLNTPTLFCLSGDDLLVDIKKSKRVFDLLPIEDKKLIKYPQMYHALSVDLGKEKVFEDMRIWMENHF